MQRGTSMAAPVVAGSLALVRQYFADGWYPSGAPQAASAFLPSAPLLKAVLLGAECLSCAVGVCPWHPESLPCSPLLGLQGLLWPVIAFAATLPSWRASEAIMRHIVLSKHLPTTGSLLFT